MNVKYLFMLKVCKPEIEAYFSVYSEIFIIEYVYKLYLEKYNMQFN